MQHLVQTIESVLVVSRMLHTATHTYIHTHMQKQRVTCNGNNNKNKKSVIGFAKRRQSTPTFLPLLNISKKGEKKTKNDTHSSIHIYIRTQMHIHVHSPKHNCKWCRRQKRKNVYLAYCSTKRRFHLMNKKNKERN